MNKYIHCPDCVKKSRPIASYSIAVDPVGNLTFHCNEHLRTFATFLNAGVAQQLRDIGKSECDECGSDSCAGGVH